MNKKKFTIKKRLTKIVIMEITVFTGLLKIISVQIQLPISFSTALINTINVLKARNTILHTQISNLKNLNTKQKQPKTNGEILFLLFLNITLNPMIFFDRKFFITTIPNWMRAKTNHVFFALWKDVLLTNIIFAVFSLQLSIDFKNPHFMYKG